MSFIYTRSKFLARINAGIQGRIGILIDQDETANEAVREVVSELDLRSTKRQASLAPKLFNDIYDYSCASDLKAGKIIDVPPQVKRSDGEWYMTTTEEFDRNKTWKKGELAIEDYNGIRVLKIATALQDFTEVVSELDSLTSGGGTWTTVGNLTSLAADTDDFIKGAGSLSGSLSASSTTTAGIQNTTLNSSDITLYMGGNGSAFAWVKINDPTNITSYQLNIGSSASNYYSKTVTTRNDGTAFVAGWNLIRFDLTSLTTVGTPDMTKITYTALFMNKTTGKISESGYKFDWLVLKKGSIYNVKYYSKYGWQTAAGAYIENSTLDTDLLVADTDEFNLFILKARIKALQELKEFDVVAALEAEWKIKSVEYQANNPSEAKIMTTGYYEYDQTHGHNYDNNDTNNRIYP